MSKPLLSDGLWARIEPLLPDGTPQRTGRPCVPDPAALAGILLVLKTGIHWELLPHEMGCDSGMTCWRRLAECNDAAAWDRPHQVLWDEFQDAGAIDWLRAIVDSSYVRAKAGAKRPARRRLTAADRGASTT